MKAVSAQVKPPKLSYTWMKNILNMFDCWADPVVTSIKDLHAQAVGSVGQVILGNPDTFLLKNEPTPASFRFFGLSKQASIQFVQQINVKKCQSIQYLAPGFEPTTFRTWVNTHNH